MLKLNKKKNTYMAIQKISIRYQLIYLCRRTLTSDWSAHKFIWKENSDWTEKNQITIIKLFVNQSEVSALSASCDRGCGIKKFVLTEFDCEEYGWRGWKCGFFAVNFNASGHFLVSQTKTFTWTLPETINTLKRWSVAQPWSLTEWYGPSPPGLGE